MLSDKLLRALNDQVNYEYYSEYVYLAMSSYCESEDLKGFANFYAIQAQEERFHATKFFNYIYQMGGRVTLKGFPEPQNDFKDILDTFIEGLRHEVEVTKRIYSLSDIAGEEKEHATISFLKWFIDEQVEEEDTFNTLIKRLKRIEGNAAALYLLDDELATRTFTPPAPQA
ncbi:MAG: ferritin [Bacillota bacterium]|nr:ferritin [Bacillota bacterium]